MTETPAQHDAPPASQILEALSAPIPPEHLAQRKQGSTTLTYIP